MRHVVILSLIALSAVLMPAHAAPATLEGNWSGSGVINHQGVADRVHCRVRYTKSGSKSFTYTSTCATETGRYELTGSVASSGSNRYSGSVISGRHRESGQVLLLQHGNSLSVTVTSRRGSAKLALSRR